MPHNPHLHASHYSVNFFLTLYCFLCTLECLWYFCLIIFLLLAYHVPINRLSGGEHLSHYFTGWHKIISDLKQQSACRFPRASDWINCFHNFSTIKMKLLYGILGWNISDNMTVSKSKSNGTKGLTVINFFVHLFVF